MPAPLAKGLIIAASVIVAAGIAVYESPQVRQWVEQYRRKIAIALHSLGDEIQPRRNSDSSEDWEERKRRREEIVRQNRNELIRKARAEGIAVDLDELARIGEEEMEMAERRNGNVGSNGSATVKGHGRTNSQKSFDDLVGSDGMLKKDFGKAENATGSEKAKEDNNLRRRGVAGFAAGGAAGLAMSNPFDDNQVIFDQDENENDEAPSPKPFTYVEGSRESSATLEGDAPPSIPPQSSSSPLIDLTPEPVHQNLLEPENPQTVSIPPSEAATSDNDLDAEEQAAQSFYSFTSSSSSMYQPNPTLIPSTTQDQDQDLTYDSDSVENISAGTLTPRSDHSGFTGASMIGSNADDIAVLSMQNETDHDARSEVFSEGGFTDAGFSEAGFSELGEQQRQQGILTPSSWTDVGSDDDSEWGDATQHGHVSQIHQ